MILVVFGHAMQAVMPDGCFHNHLWNMIYSFHMPAFMAAIRELPNKMLLCGHPDYLTFCEDLKKKVQTVRDNGGVLTNEADYTAQKAEQESAKGATCQAAR